MINLFETQWRGSEIHMRWQGRERPQWEGKAVLVKGWQITKQRQLVRRSGTEISRCRGDDEHDEGSRPRGESFICSFHCKRGKQAAGICKT